MLLLLGDESIHRLTFHLNKHSELGCLFKVCYWQIMIYLSNANLSLRSGSFFTIYMEKYVDWASWRLTFGPGSEATTPETPPDVWGLQAASCGCCDYSLATRTFPEPGPWCREAGLGSRPALPSSQKALCQFDWFSSDAFPCLPLIMCSFMELKSCPPSRNVKLLNYFSWASAENEPLGISSARILNTEKKTLIEWQVEDSGCREPCFSKRLWFLTLYFWKLLTSVQNVYPYPCEKQQSVQICTLYFVHHYSYWTLQAYVVLLGM